MRPAHVAAALTAAATITAAAIYTALHATETLDRLELGNYDAMPTCDFCHTNEATWTVIYRPCRHQHLQCGRCKTAQQQRQREAIAANRPLGTHGCCHTTVWRAGWIQL